MRSLLAYASKSHKPRKTSSALGRVASTVVGTLSAGIHWGLGGAFAGWQCCWNAAGNAVEREEIREQGMRGLLNFIKAARGKTHSPSFDSSAAHRPGHSSRKDNKQVPTVVGNPLRRQSLLAPTVIIGLY